MFIPMVRRCVLLAAVMGFAAAGDGIAAERSVMSDVVLNGTLELGESIEARVDGDLDGDGDSDTVYVVAADARMLHVLLRDDAADLRYAPAGMLRLDSDVKRPVRLAITRGVLVVDDFTGGGATMLATFRYRITRERRMRLIGLDATLDPGRDEVDGFALSWNLLDGSIVTRVLRVATDASSSGVASSIRQPMFEERFVRRSAAVLMEETPDPEFVMIDVRGR